MREGQVDLERRVTRLERHARFYQSMLLLGALGSLMAMTTDDGIMRARAVELVTDDGLVRAALRLEDGDPLLTLVDESGVDRVRLFHAAEATGLYVMDEAGTTRIGVTQFAHGGGGVALHGPESRGAAVLYLKGKGSLRFFDADGTVTMRMPPSPDRAAD